MNHLKLVLLTVLFLISFALAAYADKAITFYYRATSVSRTMVDGMYLGDKGKTALEQQNDCLEYVKGLYPFNTKFLHISCTPL